MVKYDRQSVLKFVSHSKKVISIAIEFGWLPGARYTNLRDVRELGQLGFLDIDWKRYDFARHLEAAKSTRPLMTVAKDVESEKELYKTIDQAWQLSQYSKYVVIVPKNPALGCDISSLVPECFILGYSVPTSYGGTTIPPKKFNRFVHLLGGRPDVQRKIGSVVPVFSLDCNRFTLDATYGDFFDGQIFRPHPVGGYNRCIIDSIKNINALWDSYDFLEIQSNAEEEYNCSRRMV